MWLPLAVALLTGFTFSLAEIFDVTTIYDLDGDESATGHVHVRTNALGLAVADGEGVPLTDKNFEHSNLLCDASDFEKCSWDIGRNYSLDIGVSKEIIPGQKHEITENLISIGLKMLSKPFIEKKIFIHIATHSKSSESDSFIEWHKSTPSSLYNILYYMCHSCAYYSDYDYQYRSNRGYKLKLKKHGLVLEKCCDSKISIYFTNEHDDSESAFISLNVTENQLNVHHKFTLIKKLPLVDSKLYFETYFGSDSMDDGVLVFGRPVLKAITNGAEMASPLLLQLKDTDQICISVVLYCYKDSRKDVLHVLARDLYSTYHLLHTINDVKVGWNFKQIYVKIEKEIIRPFSMIVRSLDSTSIARISSCDLDGEDVWIAKPVQKSFLSRLHPYSEEENFTEKYIYQATVKGLGLLDNVVVEKDSTNNCQNGGVMTTDGCACPPGFIGPACQTGCGPNRFGLDCRGLCSMRTKMCKELLMCNSATGCHCPPGYKLDNCSYQCEVGEYGNNCTQTCGHCMSRGACDIYTGECQACEPGYVPPYCKEAYVYYTSKPKLSSSDYGTIAVSFSTNDIAGVGIPELYQIQYRLKFTSYWYTFTSQSIKKRENDDEDGTVIEQRIEGLKTGHFYEVRVVLMDANFNKYDSDLILVSEVLTKCDIPDTVNYNLSTKSTSEFIKLSWSYESDVHWCPVESYEVSWKEGWKWMTTYTQDEVFVLNNLLPNSSIKFRVRAKTNGGYAPSSELMAHTQYQGTYKVRNLRVVNSFTTSAQISWDPPKDDDRHLKYIITFECVEQLACSPGCVNATEGTFTLDETSATVSPLLPFARYYVTVAPGDGPESGIYIGTLKTEPTEVPRSSGKGVLRTNTSLTVFWDPVPVCSSFHLGYNYHLHKESDTNKILASGFTKALNVTFDNLVASTEYSVRVFVVTIAGWNPNAFLNISTSTSATVPEVVRNLTVYKRTRNSLGLRWAAPRATYGHLKSFTIMYTLGKEEHNESVNPFFCVPWPHLYCHTIQGLRANRNYNVSVSARNSEVDEDGAKISVIGVTKESPPSAPVGLKLTNSTSNSVSVEWHYPEVPNGIIRSFLVSVEETEQFKQDDCCQVFPLVESPVQEELMSYKSEVSGLHPASTYFVSVSAKTVGLGPSQSLVVHTKPPHLPFTMLPHLKSNNEVALLMVNTAPNTWLDQVPQPQMINDSDIYKPLIKAHILLLVEANKTGSTNDSGIFNPQLNALLQDLIGKPFYFYTEYNQDNQDVILDSVPEMVDSAWGVCPLPSDLIVKDSYSLVAVQVTEYGSEFNADLRYLSEAITLE